MNRDVVKAAHSVGEWGGAGGVLPVSGGGAAPNTKPVPAGRRVPRESPGALDVGTEISSQGGVDPAAVDNPKLNAVHAHWRRLGVTAHVELALVQSPVVVACLGWMPSHAMPGCERWCR
jgi:hypothetical protein